MNGNLRVLDVKTLEFPKMFRGMVRKGSIKSNELIEIVDNSFTKSICFINNEKNILIGSSKQVALFNVSLGQIIDVYPLPFNVIKIYLINDGCEALIIGENIMKCIFDCKTYKITQATNLIITNQEYRKIEEVVYF